MLTSTAWDGSGAGDDHQGDRHVATVERSLVIIKPDAVQRGLIGAIVERYERRGLKIVAMRMHAVDRGMAERHYQEHVGKPFFAGLIDFITSSPAVSMVIEGPNAIKIIRDTNGATKPVEATPGSIRADFGLETGRNLVHASDSGESGEREIANFFPGETFVSWERAADRWILE